MPHNPFKAAAFLTGAVGPAGYPADQGAEVAFAGRSNAGKSSAINVLTEQRALARISKTPGRTREINFFTVGATDRRLVDLPGYGFARVQRAQQAQWARNIDAYLNGRESLRGIVLLSDIRHPLTEADRQLVVWALAANVPVRILLTKADKLGRGRGLEVVRKIDAELAVTSAETGDAASLSVQLFSALKGTGMVSLQTALAVWLEMTPADSN